MLEWAIERFDRPGSAISTGVPVSDDVALDRHGLPSSILKVRVFTDRHRHACRSETFELAEKLRDRYRGSQRSTLLTPDAPGTLQRPRSIEHGPNSLLPLGREAPSVLQACARC